VTLTEIQRELNKGVRKGLSLKQQVRLYTNRKPIGSGISREVFIFEPEPRYVLKVEWKPTEFWANIQEWNNWLWLKDSCYEKWLCPCYFISETGAVLIQRRAQSVVKSELPRKIPPFFLDKKVENWGRIGNKIVCLDYPHLCPDYGKMKRVYWK